MNTKRRLIVLGCLLVMVLSACGDARGDIPANKERANQLVQALGNYAAKYGQLPDSLEDLVPEFIAEIPTTVGGRDFLYYPLDDEYSLGFRVTDVKGLSCAYGSRQRDWECSFSGE